MKKLSSILVMSALAAGVALQAQAAAMHEQGGTLTVPIIATTFVDDFNPYSNCLLYTSDAADE